MPTTAAERQKASRAKRQFGGEDGNGERQLNTWLSTHAFLALDRLATHEGMTKKEFLERLLVAEQDKVLQDMNLDSPEGKKFLKETL